MPAIEWYKKTVDGVVYSQLPETVIVKGGRFPSAVLVGRNAWDTLAASGWFRASRDPLPVYSDGYGPPVTGVDEDDEPVVIIPVLLPRESDRIERARAALEIRLSIERNRRSDLLVAGSTDPAHVARTQANTLMLASAMLNAARQRPLTPEEEGLAAVLEAIPKMIQAIDDAEAAIDAWVDTHLTTVADLDDLDVAAPPAGAPQWP